jgi:hypothetical protein
LDVYPTLELALATVPEEFHEELRRGWGGVPVESLDI